MDNQSLDNLRRLASVENRVSLPGSHPDRRRYGGLSIGNHAVSRSLRVAATLLLSGQHLRSLHSATDPGVRR